MNFKTALLLRRIVSHAGFHLKHQQSARHMNGFSTASYYLVQLDKITGRSTRAIKASYLILVDEEKHDGQNLQEEDEQEEDEELWRHKGKREKTS